MFRVAPRTSRRVNVSRHGFRAGTQNLPWPPRADDFNVFVFGGSMAFGYGIDDSETIPAQLNRMLCVSDSASRVYNFACPNFDSSQSRIRFEQLLVRGVRPDVAIFIDGFANFIAPYYAPLVFRPFADAVRKPGLSRRVSRFLRGEKRTLDQLCRVPDPKDVIADYSANRKIAEAVCDAYGVRPLFVWQPAPCYNYDGDAARPHAHLHGAEAAPLLECVRAGYALMSQMRLSSREDARFLWLGDMQEGRTENLYIDADHYSAAFSQEIAAQIERHLRESGIAPKTSVPPR